MSNYKTFIVDAECSLDIPELETVKVKARNIDEAHRKAESKLYKDGGYSMVDIVFIREETHDRK